MPLPIPKFLQQTKHVRPVFFLLRAEIIDWRRRLFGWWCGGLLNDKCMCLGLALYDGSRWFSICPIPLPRYPQLFHQGNPFITEGSLPSRLSLSGEPLAKAYLPRAERSGNVGRSIQTLVLAEQIKFILPRCIASNIAFRKEGFVGMK